MGYAKVLMKQKEAFYEWVGDSFSDDLSLEIKVVGTSPTVDSKVGIRILLALWIFYLVKSVEKAVHVHKTSNAV